MRRVQKMKEDITVDEKHKMVVCFKGVIVVMCFIFLLLSIQMMSFATFVESEKKSFYDQIESVNEVRELMPELIIYRFYPLPGLTTAHATALQD